MDGIAISLGAKRRADLRPVGLWLLVCCAMVVAMIMLGGITRLTDSGLSMVHWKPLTLLPPINDAEWAAEFAHYQQTPEYRLVNHGMDLAGFKGIYWLEYLHRLAGRLTGFVFLLPFLLFWLQGRLDRPLTWRLLGLFLLGGLQGLVGWLMVKSGLVDRPDVSQYRLAAHLGLAVVILGLLLWQALDLLRGGQRRASPMLRPLAGFLGLVFVTIIAGAFVAGLDAGLVYNSFPLMDGGLLPPIYGHPFEDVAAVQFNHRLLAVVTLASAIGLWAAARRKALSPAARSAIAWLPIVALGQAGLGIATLLLVVPVPLAWAHQGGAVVLFVLAVQALHTNWTQKNETGSVT